MYADDKDLRSLLTISLAAFLLLCLKLGALVQYFQQTHHIFLEVNPNAANADWFDLDNDIETARETWDNFQYLSEERLIKVGQIILFGEDALPKPPPPPVLTCPAITPQCVQMITYMQEKAKREAVASTTSIATNDTITEIATDKTTQTTPEKISDAKALTDKDKIESTDSLNVTTLKIDETMLVIPPPTSIEPLPEVDTPIELNQGDKVLLVGDSMMQGLGPHLVSSLNRNNAVQAIDLSRHSTGLAYPHYFDWPNTILQKLQSEKFKLLMIFLGANDTWDIVIDGKYVSFGNSKWISVYSERVNNIIKTAKEQGVRVLWFGAPPMDREKMSDRIPVLNKIFESAADQYPGVARYVDTSFTLTQDGKTFSKFLDIPNRGKVMVRTDDGVHFTANGQRLLAQLALSQLVLHPVDKTTPVSSRSSTASSILINSLTNSSSSVNDSTSSASSNLSQSQFSSENSNTPNQGVSQQ